MVPHSARFAGIYGDGLITAGGKSLETYHQILENFTAGAKTAGKDPNRIPRIIELGVDFTDDKEKAIAIRKAFWAGTFVPALFTEKIYTPKMSETNGKAVGSDTISESLCISADADVHVKFARHHIDLGFNHLIFHAAGPDQHTFLDGYGRHVLPRLRQS